MKILNVAGARPNFMKIAPLVRAMTANPACEPVIVHTGQHYDDAMSKVFFDELDIPPPAVNLEVGSGTREEQIAAVMARFTPVVEDLNPDLVLVVGDVNSTIACTRVAKRLGVRVAHVEAGLRSFDRTMPEEVNRIETDELADYLFVTEPSGMENLKCERVPGAPFLVGNVMIDNLVHQLQNGRQPELLARLGLVPGEYFVGTFHRPSNVDAAEDLRRVVDIIVHAAARVPFVLPLHPRTRKSLLRHQLMDSLEECGNVHLTDPLGYVDFLSLVEHARAVVTDSGGVQEETTYLQIPCITMRNNTERPITVEVGSNVLAGTDANAVKKAIDRVLDGTLKRGAVPDLWDGHAAERIVEILVRLHTGASQDA